MSTQTYFSGFYPAPTTPGAQGTTIAPVTTASVATKAPLDSPTFTGTPAAPTPPAGDNSTRIATTAYVYNIASLPTGGTTAQYLRGDRTWQTLDKSAVGLSNVDNTSDNNKPVSTAQQTALNNKANTGSITSSGLTISTTKLAGRTTASTGSVEEITVGTNLSLVGQVLSLSDPLTISTTTEASVAIPSAGSLRVFGRDMATRPMLGSMDSFGDKSLYATHLGRNSYSWWKPLAGSNTVVAGVGFPAPLSVGTPTAVSPTSTSMSSRTQRLSYLSSTTAGSLAGQYFVANWWTTGGGSGTSALGGFHVFYRFMISDASTVSGARMFVGLSSSIAAPINVEPSSLTSALGVAQLSTSTNLQIVYGGTAAQTPIDLGTGFPATSGELYELQLFASPFSLRVTSYRLERISTGAVVTGTLPSGGPALVPAASTFLAPRAWRCNNTTAAAVSLDIINLIIESDN